MQQTLIIIQMILSVLMMISILLQSKGTGLSETFGGPGGNMQTTRRGPEKILYNATILFAVAFFGIAVALMFL